MAFVFSGRASRRECLSVFLSMTLAVAQILLGLALPPLMPGIDVFSCLFFIFLLLRLLLGLLIVLQFFALCWRRLHDLSLAGGWSFVLPFVLLAGSLPVEWLFGRLFQSDAWGMFMAHAGKAGVMAAGGMGVAVFVLSGTWVVALLGLFPGTKKENQYGHPPEV